MYVATITSAEKSLLKIYGPWPRSEHSSSLLFVNFLEDEEVQRDFDKSRKRF